MFKEIVSRMSLEKNEIPKERQRDNIENVAGTVHGR
jgi:hypothetical protein